MDTQLEPDEDGQQYETFDLSSFSVHYYAYEEAAAHYMMEKDGCKNGRYQVVLGTEKRAPRKAKTIAERPKPQGKSRVGNATSSSRTAPKSRKKA
jgi:hypothetical protein